MDLHKTNFQPIYNEASMDHDIPIDKISYGNAASESAGHHAPWRLSGGSPNGVGEQSLNTHTEGRDGATQLTFYARIVSANWLEVCFSKPSYTPSLLIRIWLSLR